MSLWEIHAYFMSIVSARIKKIWDAFGHFKLCSVENRVLCCGNYICHVQQTRPALINARATYGLGGSCDLCLDLRRSPVRMQTFQHYWGGAANRASALNFVVSELTHSSPCHVLRGMTSCKLTAWANAKSHRPSIQKKRMAKVYKNQNESDIIMNQISVNRK